MPVRNRYYDDLQRGVIERDPGQERAVEALQALHEQLVASSVGSSWWQRLMGRQPSQPAGLYLYGPVGRGKTYLVDAFFDTLPFAEKERLHFHHFMRRTHRALHELRDLRDPLGRVARDFARANRVLCFDEFHVSDITDAMILGRLLERLLAEGVTLVATSNQHPDELYQDGLQRARFLPAIDTIKANCRVLDLDTGRDYRLERLEQAPVYYTPANKSAEQALEAAFERIAPEPGRADVALTIEGRTIPARRLADGVAWFDFDTLCNGPRSQNDYMELARLFHTLLVSGVPALDTSQENAARRWIALVDELYDRRVKLICSAEAPPETLYQGVKLRFEYERTVSRLTEMQSHDYLALAHRP